MTSSTPLPLFVFACGLFAAVPVHAATASRGAAAEPDAIHHVAAAAKPVTTFAGGGVQDAAAVTEGGSFAALADKDSAAGVAADAWLSDSGTIEAMALGLAVLGLARRRLAADDA